LDSHPPSADKFPPGPSRGGGDGETRPGDSCPITVGPQGVRQACSQALLGGGTELQILHNDDIYRLTLTRSGKLILHK